MWQQRQREFSAIPVRVSAPTDDEQVLQSCHNPDFTSLLLEKAAGTTGARERVVCMLTEKQFSSVYRIILLTGVLIILFIFFKTGLHSDTNFSHL